MPAVRMNLTGPYRIQQGSTYNLEITVYDADGELMDLTNYDAHAQIRETYESPIALSFDTSITDSVISLTLPPAITTGSDIREGVWDCELHYIDGTVSRILEGAVVISPEVTREP